jgi:amino acid permease
LFLVTQIFSSGIYAGSYSVEDNEIKEIVQLNAVMFSSLIILIAFQNNNYSEQDNKMLVIALVLSLLALMYYNTPKSSSSKRIIRKMKNVFMTISIFVFMNMLYNLGCNKFGLLSESK